MKIQILVPQYKETEAEIKPLLDSIAIQQNINMNDIGVIVVNDGSDVILTDEFIKKYPYKIEYYQEKHRGVSATRNSCLDYAVADYVMFCDADDMFYNACALYIIMREINLGEFDVFVSKFVEETRAEKGEPIYINHEMDSTFVHGKAYRRQFLMENNIWWNDMLTVHEDSYFNCLARQCAKEVKYCPTSFYLWRWRDNSVCRHDPKYILKTYNNMLDSNTALVNELIRRDKRSDAESFVCSMIYDAYFTMNKDEWINQENKEYRDNTERRLSDYYKEFKTIFETIDKNKQTQILVGIKNRMFTEGLMLETVTFADWISHIEEINQA